MKIFLCALVIYISAFSKEVCILNFNKKICHDFDILESVIIKSKLSKKELTSKINKSLKQIAFLEDSKEPLIYSKHNKKI